MQLEMDTDLAEQVNQLEAVLDAGCRMPGTGRTLVDRTVMLELIDRMRVSVPEQVRAAQQVLQHRDQMLAEANAAADAILAKARREAQRRLAEEVSLDAAGRRVEHIHAQVWRRADQIERQGEQDAAERLRSLRLRLDALTHALGAEMPLADQADPVGEHVSAIDDGRRVRSRPGEPIGRRPVPRPARSHLVSRWSGT